MYVAKTKALISCAVTAQLICVFVFAYAKSRFSHNEAQNIVKYPLDLACIVTKHKYAHMYTLLCMSQYLFIVCTLHYFL